MTASMQVIGIARLRSRNQMTLPAAVAKALGAGPGGRLHFLADSRQPGVVLVSRLPGAETAPIVGPRDEETPYLAPGRTP
jgi:bifunctional DNA-binding transcriptional regulator/antitoxin component of YhaV-PrlF toxin-antitoxin module